ncbi:MAG: class I SAM-dependent methyltransferase, partial [Atopobiaceae bacterium]|nr:class I SAM-dependent methyltransferase [Atopobiaceae bacterium]
MNYDIRLSQDQKEQLIDYLLYVLERNKDINVTAITNIEEAVILHLVDSLLFLPYISAEDEFVDIGTGGGFPGVPLAICSGATGTLIDSVAKKVTVVS